MDDTRVDTIRARQIDTIIIIIIIVVIDMLHDIGSLVATHLLRCLIHEHTAQEYFVDGTRPVEITDKRQPMEEADVDIIVRGTLRSAPAVSSTLSSSAQRSCSCIRCILIRRLIHPQLWASLLNSSTDLLKRLLCSSSLLRGKSHFRLFLSHRRRSAFRRPC